jgi:hypothetical protein
LRIGRHIIQYWILSGECANNGRSTKHEQADKNSNDNARRAIATMAPDGNSGRYCQYESKSGTRECQDDHYEGGGSLQTQAMEDRGRQENDKGKHGQSAGPPAGRRELIG